MYKIAAPLEIVMRLVLAFSLGLGYAAPAAAVPLPAGRLASETAAPHAPDVAVSKADALLVDVDHDGQADPGDTLRYTVVVSNSGDTDALATVFSDTLDANLTLVPGSVEATPLAFGQALTTLEDTSLAILLTAYDADGDALVLSVTGGPAHGNLSGTAPNVTYTPDSDYNGPDSFTFQACDAACDSAQVNLTVTAVNDAPSFTPGSDITVLEDSSAYSAAWASGISAGPADEAGQLVAFQVLTNTNAALFSAGPAIAADGTLTFTPAADANGSADITVALQDNGGTANGGQDTSTSHTFTLGVTLVNDAPSFTAGSNVSVAEDSGAYSAAWAGGISAGPADEAGQTLAFSITANTNPALFSVAPAIAADGTLTFTPAADANGSADVTVSLQDNGGTANGGQDTSSPSTFTIAVGAVNDAPLADDATFAVDENSANGTVVGTVTASDVDAGQTLSYAITAGNTGGAFAINATSGQITVATASAVDFETNPVFHLSVQVSDDGTPTLSDTAAVTVTLNNLNEAPVADDATFAVDENSANGTVVGTVVATDVDAGQTLSYAITAGNTGGAFAINASTGQITVASAAALDFEANPTFDLTVQVSDNGTPGLADNATITINLNGVNESPVANDATFSLAENSANGTVVGSVTASDVDAGQTLSYAITAGNTGGAFAINAATGQITVASVAAVNFEVNPTFNLTVQVTDNGAPALSDTAAIHINLTNVNEAPVANDATFSLAENSANGTVVGSVTASDVDAGQTLSYAITAGNTGGAFAINAATGQITVATTSAANFEANPTFNLTVQVTDNGAPALSDTAAVTVNLTNVNENPAVTPATFSLAENTANGTVVGTVTASDVDAGQTLSYAITAGNTGGAFAINAATGQITVASAAALDFEVHPTFNLTVQATDNGAPALSGSATITVNLTNVNEPPVVSPATFSLAENSPNGTVVGTVTATNPEAGQTLSYAITAGNTGGAFAINAATGQITVASVAAVNFETNPTFNLTVQATDNGVPALSGSAPITVNLTNVNEAPVANDATFSLAENSANGTVVGSVTASDVDAGQTLSYAITAGNTGGAFAINAATGQITVATAGAVNFEANPTFNLTVQVTDNGAPALSDTAAVTVNLTNVNDAPVVTPATLTVDEKSAVGTVVGTVTASDQDTGQTLSYAITAGNTDGAFAINATTGQVTVANSTPLDYGVNPTFNLTVQATDNGVPALSGSATIVVNLNSLNEPPDVAPATFALAENSANGTVVGTVTYTDPDLGQGHTFAITGGNTLGAFAINAATGQITVANTAALDFEVHPTFSLTVQVTDDGAPPRSGSDTITINLTDVNEAPVADDATFSLAENSANGTVVGSVPASDVDAGQTLSYAITAGNTGGAFAINSATGQITVAAAGAVNFEANPTFNLTVQVTDNGAPGLSDTAAVTINLTNVNEAPVANDATFSLAENSANGTVVGSVSATDPDTGQTLTYAITAGNTGGAFAINSTTGQITVATASAVNFEATPTFNLTVQVSDNGVPVLSDPAAVTINLTNVNENPTVTPATFSLPENSANGTVVGTVAASDPDAGQTLAYAITAGNTGGGFTINTSTGQITVANVAALDYETTPTFNLTVQATDNGVPALSGSATITINLSDANDAPVVSPATFSLAENSANGTAVGTVTATNPEGGQTLTFAITGGNTLGAFAINAATGQITVNNLLALDYETTPTFSLTVQATDNGVPALSGSATITINLTNVNEAPVANDATFAVDENSANGTVVGTVSASDPDAGQTLTYAITAGNTGGAFAINASTGQITVATVGMLDYETTPVFNLTVQVTDNGVPNLSDTAAIRINLNNVDEAPLVVGESYDTIGNTLLQVAGTDTASGPHVFFSGNLLSNDSDPEGAALSASFVSATAGAAVVVNSNGTFTFTPPAGLATSATFTYAVSDPGGHSTNGTVTITPYGMVWYVRNNASAGGLGRSSDPFDTLTEAGPASAAGSTIYVFAGDGTSTNLDGGLTLDANQRLIGAAVALTMPYSVNGGPNPTTLVAAGSAPLVGRTASGSAVTLGSNNEIQGLNLGGAAGTVAISGTSFGTLTLSNVSINTSGQALNLDTGALAATFASITSTGGVYGINLLTTTGALTINGGALSGATTAAFRVNGGSADITYAGTVNSTSRSIDIQGRTSGTVTFSGAVNGTGTGIYLNANTATVFNFTGGVTLNTGTNAAFTATGSGTVNVTGSNNTLQTTTGTPLTISTVLIGASGVTFRSISANGAANGIVLNTTGSSGGFTLTGSGTTDGSGGTIQNTTGPAVRLTDTRNVSLSNLNISGSASHGIQGSVVNGFSLINANITSCGNAANEHGAYLQSLYGTATIQDSNISSSYDRNVWIQNAAGTLNSLTVTGNTFNGISSVGNQSFYLNLSGSAIATAATFQNNTFANNYSKALFVSAQNTSQVSSLRVESNTFSANFMSVDLTTFDTAQIRFLVLSNTMGYSGYAYPGGAGNQVNLYASGPSTLEGRVNNNDITNDPNGGGSGISALLEGNGTMPLQINGNTIRDWSVNGIEVSVRGGNGRADATITNNTVMASTNATGPAYNFYLRAGNAASTSNILCFNLTGNSAASSGGLEIANYGVDRYTLASNHTIYAQGLTPSPGTAANVQTLILANNLPAGALLDVVAGTYYNGTCNLPTISAGRGAILAETGGGRHGLASLVSPAARFARAPQAGETIQLDLATLPAGKQVTITFDAVVNDPLPQGTTYVANQAAVSGSNFATVLSDDPATPAAGDATLTPVYRPVFAPLANPDGYALNEDTVLQVAAPGVLANDSDANGDVLAAVLDTPPSAGALNLVASGAFVYTPTADLNGNITFLYHANDWVADSNVVTVTLAITPVNDAPLLDASGDLHLHPVATGDPNPAGDLVSGLLASAAGDPISDVDAAALEGIAVTAVDNTHGTWQYDAGSGWQDFGTPTENAARLLASDATTRLRFVPNASWSGTLDPAITFRAWDQTSGTNGGLGDASLNGGTTAFSLASETAYIQVAEIADLEITKVASADPVLSNTDLTYTLMVINHGPSSAAQVVVTDTLPAGLALSAVPGGCNLAGNQIVCELGTLASGNNAAILVNTHVDSRFQGALANTAQVSSDTLEYEPIDNQVTLTVTVVNSLVVYWQDFESGTAGNEWCLPTVTTAPNGQQFLGELGNQTACLTLDNLPAHNLVTVSFDLYLIRSWDGNVVNSPSAEFVLSGFDPDYIIGPDEWEFRAQGSPLLHTTFANWGASPLSRQAYPGTYPGGDYPPQTGAAAVDSLGYLYNSNPQDSVYHLTFTFDHTDAQVALEFLTNSLQSLADESWGVDNVKVTLLGEQIYFTYLPVTRK